VVIKLCELDIPDKLSSLDYEEDIQDTLEKSRACFEAIIRLYYLRHGYEQSDTFMAHALCVLSFMVLSKINSIPSAIRDTPSTTTHPDPAPELLAAARSTLILAAKGLSDQARNYYMPFTVFHLVLNKMAPEDVDILYTLANVRRTSLGMSQEHAKHVQGLYPVEVVSMVNHPEKSRMGDLIREYAGLALEERSSAEESSAAASPASGVEE